MNKLQTLNSSAGNSSVDKRSFTDGGAYQRLDSPELRVLIPVIFGIICVLGIAGNMTALGVLVTNARKGKLSLINALILNLIVADTLVLALALPVRAVLYSRASWTLGWFLCKSSDWFLHSCLAAKSFTIAAMSRACLRYVRNPNRTASVRGGAVLGAVLSCWGVACALPAPLWLWAGLRQEGAGLVCVGAEPQAGQGFAAVYVMLLPLAAFAAPLALALTLFGLAQSRCHRHGDKAPAPRTQLRSRRLSRLLLGLTVAAATLALPQWAGLVWGVQAARSGAPPPPPLFALAAQLLLFSASLVDPLALLALSEEFRERYRGLWRRLTLRKPPPPKHSPHTPTAPRSPSPRPETAGLPSPPGSPAPPAGGPAPQPEGHAPQPGGSAHQPAGSASPSSSSAPQPTGSTPQPGSSAPQSTGSASPSSSSAPQPSGSAPQTSSSAPPVLPDLEHFWSERGAGGAADETDPVPWEHLAPAEKRHT